MDYNTAPAAFITNAKPMQKNSGHGERSGGRMWRKIGHEDERKDGGKGLKVPHWY